MIVEKADYNSADNCIDFECATPVTAGETAQYPFFWPAELPSDDLAARGRHRQRGCGRRRDRYWGDRETACRLHGWHRSGRHGLRGRPERRVRGPERPGRRTPTDVGFRAQPVAGGLLRTHNCSQAPDRD